MSSNGNLLDPEERVLPTLNDDGSRRWIDPKHSSGRFNTGRTIVGWLLITLFVALPFIEVGGRPAIWLDLQRSQFTFFGKVFLATDTEVLLLVMLSIFVAVFLVTAVLGRIWCGWGCPQTVYMEMVYRPVERFFQRFTKGYKRGWRIPAAAVGKQLTFVAISLGLAHTFLAYFVSVDELARWVRLSPVEHPGPFAVMLGTAALIMFDFAYFREQMCTVICPYARLQSVLLDKDSLIVGYDPGRGEPRGREAAKEIKKRLPLVERAHGDCIACGACVATCPTGIDIREGLQLECIGCAQCIDACDAIMDKVGAPRGLIRYSAQSTLEEGREPKLLRARTIIYPVVLLALLGGLAFAVSGKKGAEVKAIRGVGAPFMEQADGTITNQVRVRIANRGDEEQPFALTVKGAENLELIAPANPLVVAPNATESSVVFIKAPRAAFAGGDVPITIVVTEPNGATHDIPFRLLGPAAR